MANDLTVAPIPTTEESALILLTWLYSTIGVPTDTNQGSIVRTYSEAIGSVEEIEGVEAQAQALQALVYSSFNAFGITPLGASSAVGTVTFSTLNSQPLPAGINVLIPLNTIVQTQTGIQFTTTASAILVSGTSSVNAPIQASTSGTIGNVNANTINQSVGLSYPLSVNNSAATAGGANAETVSQTLGRFMATVWSLGLCSPTAIAGAVIGVSYGQEQVKYATVYEAWIAQAASGITPLTIGYDVGIDNGSGAASANLISAVTTYLSSGLPAGYRPAGVPFVVSAVTPVYCSVVVVGTAINSAVASAISTSISQAITAYFSTLGFGDTAELTQLIASIANASFGQLSSLSVSLLDHNGNPQQTITPTLSQGNLQRVILLSSSITVN